MDGLTRCPLASAIKLFALLAVSMFVLHLPLGDPTKECNKDTHVCKPNTVLCCVCDVYSFMVIFLEKAQQLIIFLFNILWDIMYEAKLLVFLVTYIYTLSSCLKTLRGQSREKIILFYDMLYKVDRTDLCRSVRCYDLVHQGSGDKSRQRCRMNRNKCVVRCLR